MLYLTILVLVTAIFKAFILYDVQRIVNGGETNYVSATLAIYLNVYNVFSSLLQLLGIVGGEREERRISATVKSRPRGRLFLNVQLSGRAYGNLGRGKLARVSLPSRFGKPCTWLRRYFLRRSPSRSRNSATDRSETSCMRIRIEAPAGRRRWPILLMTGGATSSARDKAASFLAAACSAKSPATYLGRIPAARFVHVPCPSRFPCHIINIVNIEPGSVHQSCRSCQLLRWNKIFCNPNNVQTKTPAEC